MPHRPARAAGRELTEDLLGGPAVVIMLAREMDHLVTGSVDPDVAIRVEAQMGYWRSVPIED